MKDATRPAASFGAEQQGRRQVPHTAYELDLEYYGRFEREERIGQRLSHPNIVRMLPTPNRSRT